jgi:hypothetical protein
MLPAPEMIGNLARWDWLDVRQHIKARNGLVIAETGDSGESDEYSSGLRKALPSAPKAAASD